MVHEPSRGEIRVANLALKTFLRPAYSRFVKDLELVGDEVVMDYGSGPGIMSRMIAIRLKKGHLTCVDASRNWIKVAKRNMSGSQNVEFRLGRISDIAFPSPFDVIVVHYVLHEVPRGQRESTIKTLVSNLKADGRLVIREPTRDPPHGMPSTEIKELMISAGLVETSGHSQRSHYTGIYGFPRANDRR
jgi:2-polyprenyl-3-methyl-5-hydroxy-6-metoxy-1,4-benzoquinol methylase